MKRPRVFVTGSLWSLLTYMLVSSEDDIRRTHYFFTDKGIHKSIRKNFKHQTLNISWDDNVHWRITQAVYTFAPLYYRLRFPYLLYADMYGIDQGWAIRSVLGRRKYVLIEDGILDYQAERNLPKQSGDWVRQLIWGPIYKHDLGRNKNCRHIVLTQPFENPILKQKAKHYDLQELWDKSSESKKTLILEKFNLSADDVTQMSQRPVILLTQALSEDGIMSEEEKIALYRKMVEPYGIENVMIKPHPRETTNYSQAIPEALSMEKVVPFQLFSLIGVNFKTVVTVCSGSALSLQHTGASIDFKGSTIDRRIADKYGVITKDSYK